MRLTVNQVEINYRHEGVGQPLILLHGNGEDHTIFSLLIENLKTHFSVYALDSRNHGESSKTEDYSYETMAEDVYQFIRKLDLKNVVIVGFSDGAIIATLAEITYPGLFSKMILLGINLKPSDFKEENITYLEEEYTKTKDPLIKIMMEEPNIELSDLKSIAAPVLIVRAEDELFRDSLYEEMVSVIEGARLLIMTGHDHSSYVVNSTVLLGPILQFVLKE